MRNLEKNIKLFTLVLLMPFVFNSCGDGPLARKGKVLLKAEKKVYIDENNDSIPDNLIDFAIPKWFENIKNINDSSFMAYYNLINNGDSIEITSRLGFNKKKLPFQYSTNHGRYFTILKINGVPLKELYEQKKLEHEYFKIKDNLTRSR
jgi:hypothetical protein